MKFPRPRFSLRVAMILVVVIALSAKWAIDRPYPNFLFSSACWYVVWSDGTTSQEFGSGKYEALGTSWFQFVHFPDGRWNVYLTVRPSNFDITPVSGSDGLGDPGNGTPRPGEGDAAPTGPENSSGEADASARPIR